MRTCRFRRRIHPGDAPSCERCRHHAPHGDRGRRRRAARGRRDPRLRPGALPQRAARRAGRDGRTPPSSPPARRAVEPPTTFPTRTALYTGPRCSAAPALTDAHLDRYFKPARVRCASPRTSSARVARVPASRIVRDAYNVPHVFGETRADTMFGAGYATAQDRLFLMDVLRHTGRARLTELIGAGRRTTPTVKADAAQLKVADYDEDELQPMIDRARGAAGAEGATIQARPAAPTSTASTRTSPRPAPTEQAARRVPGARRRRPDRLEADRHGRDRVADRRHLRQGRRQRGAGRAGAAPRRPQRFGTRARARGVRRLPLAATSPRRRSRRAERFPFDRPGPRRTRRRSRCPTSARSRRATRSCAERRSTGAVAAAAGPAADLPIGGLPLPARAVSNALLVGADRVAVRHADRRHRPAGRLLLAQILMEIDLHGAGIDARGATFPGISLYVLLGRGQDFAWSATTAYSDVVDQFVEKLCEPGRRRRRPESDHYLYKGAVRAVRQERELRRSRSRPRRPIRRATPPRTIRMQSWRSVHGPIQARATVGGAAGRDRRGALDLLARDRVGRRLQAAQLRRGDRARGLPADDRARATSPSTASTSTSATSPTSPTAGTRGGRRASTPTCPRGAPASGTGRASSPATFASERIIRRAAAEADRPQARLHRELEQQAGARLARGRRQLVVRLAAARAAAGEARARAASRAGAS